MTVNIETNRVVYTGNGATTVFPFTFKVMDEDHLFVYLYITATKALTLIPAANYSVSGVPGTGSVTYNPGGVPVPSTRKLIIIREVPLLQALDIMNQGGFLPESIEDQLDLLEMQIQQMNDVLLRVPTAQLITTTTNFTLPEPEDGKVLGWDGTTLANLTADSGGGGGDLSPFVVNTNPLGRPRVMLYPGGYEDWEPGITSHTNFGIVDKHDAEGSYGLWTIHFEVPDYTLFPGDPTEKMGLFIKGGTAHASDGSKAASAVMIELQPHILAGNLNGEIWGISQIATVQATADGSVRGFEVGITNEAVGGAVKELGLNKSKLVYAAVANGSIGVTAAFSAQSAGGSPGFYKGLVMDASALVTDAATRFIELTDLFEVLEDGTLMIGKGALSYASPGVELYPTGEINQVKNNAVLETKSVRLGTNAGAVGIHARQFFARSTTGTERLFGEVDTNVLTATNAAEQGEHLIRLITGGALTNQFGVANGAIVGTPTGSYKGTGTLNIAIGLYVGGTILPHAILQATTESFLTAHKAKLDFLTITQAVDLDAIETRVNALDAAVVLKGTWDASAGTFPGGGTAQAGESWIVSVGGTVNSVVFNVGDRIIAILDNASTGTFAANWFKADYTDLVSSVAGKTGIVTLQVADITDMTANGRSLVSAANYAAMRGLLDLEAGTDFYSITAADAAFQPKDSDLTSIAGLAPSNDDVVQRKAGAWANRTLAQLMTDLAALGTTFQPLDADLTAIAAVATAAYGRSLLALANATALAAEVDSFFLTPTEGNAAYQPLDADLTSWAAVARASGFDTFVATPSSANLRALLTDEVGTGAAYFVGGALGTPASGTLTNATGLPVAGITASTSTALGVGTLELGHATDTTLSRPGSGRLAVEGRDVFLQDSNGDAGVTTTMRDVVVSRGIKFPATFNNSADANTLDDYEEGTFTPIFAATGSTFAYSIQIGRYTKIGNRCLITVTLALAGAGNTLTANPVAWGNMPFTSHASAGYATLQTLWLATQTAYVGAVSYLPAGTISPALGVWTAASTSAAGAANANALLSATAGTLLAISGQYETA